MFHIYIFGYIISVLLLLGILIRTEFWNEDDGVESTNNEITLMIIASIIVILVISLASWGMVLLLVSKSLIEKKGA